MATELPNGLQVVLVNHLSFQIPSQFDGTFKSKFNPFRPHLTTQRMQRICYQPSWCWTPQLHPLAVMCLCLERYKPRCDSWWRPPKIFMHISMFDQITILRILWLGSQFRLFRLYISIYWYLNLYELKCWRKVCRSWKSNYLAELDPWLFRGRMSTS